MAKDSTISWLIWLAVAEGTTLLISIFFLIKGKFRINKLISFLRLYLNNHFTTIVTVFILCIMIAPYLLNLAMGLIVLVDTSMLPHIGIGILTLGWLSYSLFIAFGHWYYKFFKATILFKLLMILAILSFWGYLFAVLYAPDYYSFIGASAVYIVVNYFFALSFMDLSFFDNYTHIPTLLDEFVLFFTGRSTLMVEGALKRILENSTNFSESKTLCKRVLYGVIYLCTLVAYSVTSYILSKDGHKFVAGINSIYLVSSDIILYVYTKWVDPRLVLWANGIVMLIYRGAVAVSVNYWVLGQTVGFLSLGFTLIQSMIDIIIPLKVGGFSWNKNTWLSVGGLFILVTAFLADMFLATIGYEQAILLHITFTNSYNQYVFGISSVIVLIAYFLFRLWYRKFYLRQNKFTLKETIAVIVFWILASSFGVIGYYQFQTNPTILISTSIAACPIIVSAISFFSTLYETGNKPGENLDIQQIISLIIFYTAIIAYGATTTLYYDPPYVGYTIGTGLLIIWCGGLSIWEYIGKRYEWSLFAILNALQFLGFLIAWSTVYLLVACKDEEKIQSYALFWIFGILSIGFLAFALICFVDTNYELRLIIYINFVLAFISGIAAATFLTLSWFNVTFLIFFFICAYFVYLYINYKRNNKLHIALKISIFAILGLAFVDIIITSVLLSSNLILLVVFGIFLGTISGILLYLYIGKVMLFMIVRKEVVRMDI